MFFAVLFHILQGALGIAAVISFLKAAGEAPDLAGLGATTGIISLLSALTLIFCKVRGGRAQQSNLDRGHAFNRHVHGWGWSVLYTRLLVGRPTAAVAAS